MVISQGFMDIACGKWSTVSWNKLPMWISSSLNWILKTTVQGRNFLSVILAVGEPFCRNINFNLYAQRQWLCMLQPIWEGGGCFKILGDILKLFFFLLPGYQPICYSWFTVYTSFYAQNHNVIAGQKFQQIEIIKLSNFTLWNQTIPAL